MRAGKWPQDATGFAKMRAALGCQLAEAVAGAYGLRTAASEACVDVFADGFAFRLYLHSERLVPPQAKLTLFIMKAVACNRT